LAWFEKARLQAGFFSFGWLFSVACLHAGGLATKLIAVPIIGVISRLAVGRKSLREGEGMTPVCVV
jgi:hypothetical protein